MARELNAPRDAPVGHYSLKNRLMSWLRVRLFDGMVYTVRHGLLTGMKRKGGLGWLPALFLPRAANAEERLLAGLSFDGVTVYDIGAYHGYMALFFASRASSVICFEPNSRNRRRLEENLALNRIQNVEVRPVGVGSRREVRRMVASPLWMGGASVDTHRVEDLIRAGVETVAEDIAIVALDDEISQAGLPKPDFIKIDTEGWELEALRGARHALESARPALFLEMHGETRREKESRAAEIVAFLWSLNYRRILHVETGTIVTPEDSSVAADGHLYCTAN